MFGLLTGLTGPYYQYFRDNPFTPVPTQILKKAGYQFYSHSGAPNTWEKMDKLLMPLFEAETYEVGSLVENEAEMTSEFVRSLTESQSPRFDYLIYNSTHFPYDYGEEFDHFTPALSKDGLHSIQNSDNDF